MENSASSLHLYFCCPQVGLPSWSERSSWGVLISGAPSSASRRATQPGARPGWGSNHSRQGPDLKSSTITEGRVSKSPWAAVL